MKYRVFQQIHQHLLHQNRIHGNADKFLGNPNQHLLGRVMLAEFHQQRVNQFFQHRITLCQTNRVRVNPGNGQKIFHHAVQPLRLGANVLQEHTLFFPGYIVKMLQHGTAGAINGGQRGSQIMRHGPEQIPAHPFLFRLRFQLFLMLQAGGQCTGHNGDDQHHCGRGNAFR